MPADDGRLDALRRARVVAVLRAGSAAAAVAAADALVAGGVRAIEVTYTTPGAGEAIAAIARRHGEDVRLGAGTVLEAWQAEEAVAAGATFLVAPGTDAPVVAAMAATGAVTLVGAITPTEVLAARRAGADAVKLFPAGVLGVGMLKALREPFPDLPVVPTGGIGPGDVAGWFAAGALAVGAGGSLCPRGLVDAGATEDLQARAEAFVRALDATPAGA